jgi:hypothetical protein
MARRKELRGIAYDLAASFASRNNDAEGYWAVGKLYSYSLQSNTKRLSFDLLSAPDTDASGSLDIIVRHRCAAALGRQLTIRAMPRHWIVSATVHFAFEIPREKLAWHENYGRGCPFECVVEIADELGRRYSGTARGLVAPHDPSVDRQRYRWNQ